MKLSDYIIETSNESGYLLTNFYSGSDVLLNEEQHKEYTHIISNLPYASDSELYRCLREQMFIIYDYDELAVMQLKRNVAVFNMNPSGTKFVIAPTFACNARCSYCYEKALHQKIICRPRP